jgi:hypothetical protein
MNNLNLLNLFKNLILYSLIGKFNIVKNIINVINENKVLKIIDNKVNEKINKVDYLLCELENNIKGKYDKENNLIMINKNLNEEEIKEVLKHEVGHMVINEMFVDEVEKEMYNAFLDARDAGEVNFVMVYAYRYAMRVVAMNNPRVNNIKQAIKRFM